MNESPTNRPSIARRVRLSVAALLLLSLIAALGISTSGCTSGPPSILEVTELDNTTSAIGPYEVVATVLDEGSIDRVELLYRLNGGEWQAQVMAQQNGTTWVGHIPGQPYGTTVEYEVAALDDDKEITRLPENADVFTFQVVSP